MGASWRVRMPCTSGPRFRDDPARSLAAGMIDRPDLPVAVRTADSPPRDAARRVSSTRLASLLASTTTAHRSHKINSVHHQCVKDLAPNFVVEARCPDDGTVEAIRHSGPAWVAGVQWHPEFHGPEHGTLDDTPVLLDFLAAAKTARTQTA